MPKTRTKESLTQEQIQKIIPEIANKLNRNGETEGTLAALHGVSPVMIRRIATLLRKAGQDIPKVKYGLKAAVQKFVESK